MSDEINVRKRRVMKVATVLALTIAFSAECLGQIDRSKEVKPTVTERPAVEHVYSCPDGYELKRYVPAPTYYATFNDSIPVEHYEDGPAQDILRGAQPTCAPKPKPVKFSSLSSFPQSFTFTTSDGQQITIHLDTGKVDMPANYGADKSAREFWEALRRYAGLAK